MKSYLPCRNRESMSPGLRKNLLPNQGRLQHLPHRVNTRRAAITAHPGVTTGRIVHENSGQARMQKGRHASAIGAGRRGSFAGPAVAVHVQGREGAHRNGVPDSFGYFSPALVLDKPRRSV
jgi:hypothetical protein